MKKYTIELSREQMEQLGLPTEGEFEYPIFKKAIDTGKIVKFTGLGTVEVMWKCSSVYKIGNKYNSISKHTDSGVWEDVPYNRERDLYHGQVVECWNDMDTHRRETKFYDAINDCTFNYGGKRCGVSFDNYKAVPLAKIPDWTIEAYKTLEGM